MRRQQRGLKRFGELASALQTWRVGRLAWAWDWNQHVRVRCAEMPSQQAGWKIELPGFAWLRRFTESCPGSVAGASAIWGHLIDGWSCPQFAQAEGQTAPVLHLVR